jgi:hypothetical protein
VFNDAPLHLKPPELRWRVVPVPAGESLKGWYCGPIRTVRVHWKDGASRPCRSLLTDGRVRCYCEEEPHTLRTVGYVPLITREREQLVIVVSATVAQSMKLYAHATPLEFSRSRRAKTPLRVKQCLAEELGTTATSLQLLNKPRDIRPYLVHLWQDSALINHFAQVGAEQLPQVNPAVLAIASNSALDPSPVAPDNHTQQPPAPKKFRGSN